MPPVEEYVTLECISNLVGGDLISNAKWRGVPLRMFLERARLKPSVVDISFYAQDGYSESIPLEMAMRDEVIVAYEMNGEPLPSKHGFPARLIVPGYFGLKHVKWLTKIEPVVHDFRGYWQQRGWTDVPWVKTFSRIDVPSHMSVIEGGMLSLGGVAFAGDRVHLQCRGQPGRRRDLDSRDQHQRAAVAVHVGHLAGRVAHRPARPSSGCASAPPTATARHRRPCSPSPCPAAQRATTRYGWRRGRRALLGDACKH